MKQFLLFTLCILFHISQAQIWKNITPSPEHFGFAQSNPDTVHLRGIENSQSLSYSNDGGLTWNPVSLPGYLVSIQFPDPQNGFVTSDLGRLFHTSDGCLTWDTLMLPDNQWYGINFFNDTTGYTYTQDADTVYKTTDGGHTWFQIKTGLPINSRVFFLNDSTAWSLFSGDSIIYKTKNSFSSFDTVFLPHVYFSPSIQILDTSTAWIAGQGSPDSLMYTNDGGNSWSVRQNIYTNNFIFRDSLNGIYQYDQFSPYVYHTQDGGFTWTLTDTLIGVCSIVQNKFFVIGRGAIKSSDGINWTQFYINNFPDIYYSPDYIFTRPELIVKDPSTMIYISGDEQTGMAFFANYSFLSTDSGKHWKALDNLWPVCKHLQIISDSLWYLTIISYGSAGSVGFFNSTDMGNSYTLISDSIGSKFYFTNSLHGVAAGHYTNDGGVTWIPNGSANYGTDYSFIDSLNGWTIGTTDISRTSDGGISWTPIGTIPYTSGCTPQIQFTDSMHGFISVYGWGSCSPTVFKTIDGGFTFQQIPITFNVTSCYFTDSIHGWFAGSDGIFYTDDGGINFIQQSIKRCELIAFIDSVHGYCSGRTLFMKTDQTGIINSIDYPSKSKDDLVVFPNPSNGILNLQLPQAKSTLKMFDLFGRLVYSINEASEKISINISNLPRGNYVIEILYSDKIVRKKIIKV